MNNLQLSNLQFYKIYKANLQASGCSEKTLIDYENKIRKFYIFLSRKYPDLHLTDLTLDVLFDYVAWLRECNKNSITVQSYVRSLRAFLNWLYTSGYIQEDFCSRFRLPKARRSYIDVLTDDEVSRIYACYPDVSNVLHLRNRLIISLMLDCGLRLNEVVTSERKHLHINEGYLIVTGKGNKQRAVSFGNLTKIDMLRYFSRAPTSNYLLLNSDGSPLTADTVKNMFRKLKGKCGIDRLHPHLLRHTFATRFLENGGDIYTLKDLLGHTTLKQVQAYLHLSSTRIVRDYERYSPLDNINKPLLTI